MAIGFSGSLVALTQPQADTLCKALWYYRKYFEIMHTGDRIGAEEYAARYWISCAGALWLHPPQERTYRAFLTGSITSIPQPYSRRNMSIVLASDVVIACPNQYDPVKGSSTWMTIKYAREADKNLYIIYPCGRVKHLKAGATSEEGTSI